MPGIAADSLYADLNESQRLVVAAPERRVVVIAGAGSGKTEVISRRIANWLATCNVSKDRVVAFTFTEKAAEELRFRIQRHVQAITPAGEDATLEGIFVGTLHAFALKTLRDLWPDRYRSFDILDEGARYALIQRGFYSTLGLAGLQAALGFGQMRTIEAFSKAYDLLNEHAALDVDVPPGDPPSRPEDEVEWCKRATLRTPLGTEPAAEAFGTAAARFYAYLLCRRFLDFSTSQAELVRLLNRDANALALLRSQRTHIVVDELQDINPVQDALIRQLVGDMGALTAVGDHRQAIYRFRGSQVSLMARFAAELAGDPDGHVYELTDNFRSTPTILSLANSWTNTIGPVGALPSPAMTHANARRDDRHASHVSLLEFASRDQEAEWIASAVSRLVRQDQHDGAVHDTRDGERGLTFSDIAILLRSSTDARRYMVALEQAGIPAVFRAGPDLFAQPEVLLLLGALGRVVGLEQFPGMNWGHGLPARIKAVLGCEPTPENVIEAASETLRRAGLPIAEDLADRLLYVTSLIRARLDGSVSLDTRHVETPSLAAWLKGVNRVQRVFPQQLYQWLLAEADVQAWDTDRARNVTAMFHLGQLSRLLMDVESAGTTDPKKLRYQIIALCLWGADSGRVEEAPLLVAPDAVLISTVHGAKGLQFPAVFLADVVARRFPSNRARSAPNLPLGADFQRLAHIADLADNENYDDERRLMYVAMTRAERFLFVSSSAPSSFFGELETLVAQVGGTVNGPPEAIPAAITYRPSAPGTAGVRLNTSFSDLRYYLECPHDYFLRRVLGFAPVIDEVFGYGRGIHNLMRAIHNDPRRWARLASSRRALERAIRELIDQGLLFLRYAGGEPRADMEARAVEAVADYVRSYAAELGTLNFEPEREFETLIGEEDILVSGAIDVLRLDDPPRVTLVDFKSGGSAAAGAFSLDEEEMKLQVALYGIAAKRELEYEPERGLVRYLGEPDAAKAELEVPLDDSALEGARRTVVETARLIRGRWFHEGPTRKPRDPKLTTRCGECDFREFCGMRCAKAFRKTRGRS